MNWPVKRLTVGKVMGPLYRIQGQRKENLVVGFSSPPIYKESTRFEAPETCPEDDGTSRR